jgi:hypothetical protein
MPASPAPEQHRSLIRRLLTKYQMLQQRGLPWLGRRLQSELVSPTTAPARAVRDVRAALDGAAGAAAGAAFRRLPDVASESRRTLYFFFDLSVCPLAYDIATFMAGAELERRRRGLERIHVIVVPGENDRLRLELPEYDAAVGEQGKRWRLHNLVLPVIGLLPSCSGYTLCASRAHARALQLLYARHVHPEGWRPAFPIAPDARKLRAAARAGEAVFPALQASQQALKYVDQFLGSRAGGRRPVVITLRQYGFTPSRNSNLGAWTAFADGLDAARYAAVFVLDTDTALLPVPDAIGRHLVMHAAPWSVPLRMALYERAFVNLAVAHGPMELCWYDEACRYMVFCPVGTGVFTEGDFLQSIGFEIGKSLPFARPWQRWVWKPDDAETIRAEFDRFLPELEAAR